MSCPEQGSRAVQTGFVNPSDCCAQVTLCRDFLWSPSWHRNLRIARGLARARLRFSLHEVRVLNSPFSICVQLQIAASSRQCTTDDLFELETISEEMRLVEQLAAAKELQRRSVLPFSASSGKELESLVEAQARILGQSCYWSTLRPPQLWLCVLILCSTMPFSVLTRLGALSCPVFSSLCSFLPRDRWGCCVQLRFSGCGGSGVHLRFSGYGHFSVQLLSSW